MYNKKSHLHFVGIGGIGMSGIAKILRFQGYTISGCDSDVSKPSVQELQKLGCSIHQGNDTADCHDPSINILIYSSAIAHNNPEIIRAQQRGIPTIPRALMLAELMRTKFSIAISGSHGKTTTTSLISHVLIEAKKDPTVIIGGHLKTLSTNAHFGLGDFLVAEADESDRSLLHLQATIAVVTNINREHLDIYHDIEDIKNTFKQFLYNLPFYGTAILCSDNAHIRSLLPLNHIKTIKYGIDYPELADIWATSIDLQPDYTTFRVYHKDTELGSVLLSMPGKHNVWNALATIAVARELDIPFEQIKEGLASFKGVDRRFTFKKTYKNAAFFDDYGHHPEEIKNAFIIAKNKTKNKLHVVFQPHRFSRTQKLWDEFVSMFLESAIDSLIITDIYPASEAAIPGITGESLAQAIKEHNPHFSVRYVPFDKSFTAITTTLNTMLEEDDLVLLQGAGKLNELVEHLPE